MNTRTDTALTAADIALKTASALLALLIGLAMFL